MKMGIQKLKLNFPDIVIEELFTHFPRISLTDYPELKGYSWEDCHDGFIGAGGLFLVSEMAQKLKLKAGMRVLDLCCGNCASSIFLAKHFDVNVVAADIGADPTENWKRVHTARKRINTAGLTQKIMPIRMDATNILLPNEYFDAIFCMNSYFYFGTDDQYLSYLMQFLRKGGRIGIASPCYADELTPDTPREFLYDAPDFIESYSVHSPQWWAKHFEKTGLVQGLVCEEHPKGREFWLDDVRWLTEKCHPRDMEPEMREMVLQEIVMLLTDQERFVTYLTLVAERL